MRSASVPGALAGAAPAFASPSLTGGGSGAPGRGGGTGSASGALAVPSGFGSALAVSAGFAGAGAGSAAFGSVFAVSAGFGSVFAGSAGFGSVLAGAGGVLPAAAGCPAPGFSTTLSPLAIAGPLVFLSSAFAGGVFSPEPAHETAAMPSPSAAIAATTGTLRFREPFMVLPVMWPAYAAPASHAQAREKPIPVRQAQSSASERGMLATLGRTSQT